MEPNEVLNKFLDYCSNKNNQCHKYAFASNGILEWFGRNIKHNNKIFEYYRYNISHQYEHIFSVAIRCEAFEEKSVHKTTRNQQSDMAVILPRGSNNIYTTPPSSSVSKEIDLMQTPPRTTHPSEQEHSSNTHFMCDEQKQNFSETDDEVEKPSSSLTRNLRKRTIISPEPTSPIKRNKKNSAKETEEITFSEPDLIPKECFSSSYSCELKYIEAIGTVRKLRKLKHRGIDVGVKDVRNIESPHRNHEGDKNTKLKISYRENVSQNDIQFVLVIYQHIENNPRCKRDLMAEFTKTCNETSEHKIDKKCKTSKNVKMRRLRF